ncbi:Glycoside hydrolase family 9 - like 3, partial [Theobroma cacao]
VEDLGIDNGRYCDKAVYQSPSEEEVKQGWLLRPPMEMERKRKKKKKRCMNSMVLVAKLLGFLALIAFLVTRSCHRRPLPVQDNYTIASSTGAYVPACIKIGRLPANNNASRRGNSCLDDGNGYLNGLEVGYYDGRDGDAVKHQNCQEGLECRDSKKPNPNAIVGAMVTGPDKGDGFQDNRSNYNYTEPTIAGSAGLVAELVALLDGSTLRIDNNTTFYAIPPLSTLQAPPPPPYKP